MRVSPRLANACRAACESIWPLGEVATSISSAPVAAHALRAAGEERSGVMDAVDFIAGLRQAGGV